MCKGLAKSSHDLPGDPSLAENDNDHYDDDDYDDDNDHYNDDDYEDDNDDCHDHENLHTTSL